MSDLSELKRLEKMATSLLYTKDLDRWYPLKPLPITDQLITDDIRFKVVPAGRRSGKTERAKRKIIKACNEVPGNYFVAAPTRDQVKKIYWNDLKKLAFTSSLLICFNNYRKPSESDLIIYFPNGSILYLIGLDTPQRIEGIYWMGGIIDEIADIKEGAWEENISPALDTFNPLLPDYRAWCWLIGVPDGLNFYYDMAMRAKSGRYSDWKMYTWLSSEILPPDVIQAAKERLSARQFRQEYEACFEGATGRIYENYGDYNETNELIKPHEQLLWMHDFNFTPLSSAIGVRRGTHNNDLYLLDEIVLESAISRQSALEFIERYKDHQNRSMILYGDPAGRAGEKHGHNSDYNEMENLLKTHNWKVERRVKAAAPGIKDRHNEVRAKCKTASGHVSFFVNPQKCEYVHKGLSTVQFKKGSTFLEDDANKYQHITTALGYCINYEWPITINEEVILFVPLASVNHYNGKR
jgi:hypothetical protein